MSEQHPLRIAGIVVAAAAAVVGFAPAASAATPSVIYVSPGPAGPPPPSPVVGSCPTTQVHSIQWAVDHVASSGTVVVCAGVFREKVDILDNITLRGLPYATIDAAGLSYGIGIGQEYVTVTGMTVENAGAGLGDCQAYDGAPQCDGILTAAYPPDPFTSGHLTITHNVLVGNRFAGIDVNDTHDSLVSNNVSAGNGIGINVDDNVSSDIQFPVHDNAIIGNSVANNTGAGIRVADSAGGGNPQYNGILNTQVRDNTLTGNGGPGILLAAPKSGGMLKNNVFSGNRASGNGGAGFALRVHVGNAQVTGDSVNGNDFGANRSSGNYGDTRNTAIYLGSASPLSVTVRNNRIHDDYYGFFVAGPVTVLRSGNVFTDVTNAFHQIGTYAGS
jgi:parallel beta-helix repeat protein